MVEIHIEPQDVWDYFAKEKSRMEDEMVEIAKSDNGNAVYLTEMDGYPYAVVLGKNEVTICEEALFSRLDAKDTVDDMYMNYLFSSNVKSVDKETQEKDEIALDMMISDRENEILAMFDAFIDELSEFSCDLMYDKKGIKQYEEMMNEVFNVIASYGVKVYRPMYVEVNGEEIFSEYPHNEYDMQA